MPEEETSKHTECARCVLVVTELLILLSMNFGAKKSIRSSRGLVLTELITGGNHCSDLYLKL